MAGFEPTATQKPGFIPNLSAITRLLVKKPGFSAPSLNLRTATQKPGFLPNLRASTKDFAQKTRFLDHIRKSKI
jgi:hypothetical protein